MSCLIELDINDFDINNTENIVTHKNKLKLKLIKHYEIKFRTEIYEHIIKGDENKCFDVEKWGLLNELDKKIVIIIRDNIIEELKKLGWKCQMSYGNTVLFIYTSVEKPASCW